MTSPDDEFSAILSGERAPPSLWRRLPPSGRLFVRFWGGVGVLLLIAAATLRFMPASYLPEETKPRKHVERATSSSPHATGAIQTAGVRPIAEPIPALLAPMAGDPDHHLPQRGPNGETPREAYAAALPMVPQGNVRVALLLSGFGMSQDMSETALDDLPSGVSFAVPASAAAAPALLDESRKTGHELFLALPMEPASAPLDDEGPHSLGYDHTGQADQNDLYWSLSRFDGYVGVTNAFSGQDGGAYAQSPDFRMVAKELDQRGLLYFNATPGAPRYGPVIGGDASFTFDTAADADGVDSQLAWLLQIAKAKGEATGVAGPIRPVLVQRIAAWAKGLAAKGVTLVPVSSLSDKPASAASSPANRSDASADPALASPPAPTVAVSPSVNASPLPPTSTPAVPVSPSVSATPLPPPAADGVATPAKPPEPTANAPAPATSGF
ncbi:hypothetical protein AA23498_2988 [Acetobacter nitrogenifigens DSM 23921 = NBRC 105050]|uniref:Uncharacterized protein n=1 Tax=Acetobacter nitrogenifigens DSM 23921 = NBRC 105050 TaxID=1120919 RepID=A0A511XA34_9PROT|nr:divergent polysaccharide deacetylase family protein [Acetobacter nitrogenifigens]GBQ97762.1 hypothetical protein AA23498_2988 [Acetobacter nitrogenifigens DSM 23921 = NBRC 105050]GEN59806.1 hypothetical protein ANI02nite_16900 [Acetobacter nitrogenifigens DSM 23921 = NBRC 105050]